MAAGIGDAGWWQQQPVQGDFRQPPEIPDGAAAGSSSTAGQRLTSCDLRLEKGPAEAEGQTMQLFPTRPGIAPQLSQDMAEAQEKAPLTIFYEGEVHVFDDIPTDKAKELMQQLARTLSASQAPPESGSLTGTKVLKRVADILLGEDAEEVLDMPARRNASLQCFLRKGQRNPADYAYQKIAGDKDEAADFSAINDSPSASAWLQL